MSEILASWLNEQIGLSSRVDPRSLELDFSNGFLFGEVLHKHGLQSDFDMFANRSTTESKVLNFSRLETSLKDALGIVLTSKLASDIMAEKKGAAGKLLLQMKLALENLAKARNAIRDTTRLNSLWSSKPSQKAQASLKFKESLRQKTPRYYDLSSAVHLKKYTDEGERNKQLSARLQQQDEDGRHEKLSARRQDQIHRLKDNQRSAKEWDEQNAQIHLQSQQSRMERERYERDVALAKEEKKRLKAENEKRELALDIERNIENFEKSIGIAAPNYDNSSDENSMDVDHSLNILHNDADIVVASHTTAYEHIEELKKRVPGAQEMKMESEDFIRKLKEKKQNEEQNRLEREKRRRKVMLDQMKAYSEVETKREEQLIVSKLMKQSDGEKLLGNRLLYIRREKEVVRKNRAYREKQYAEQRYRDIMCALERDRLIANRNEEEYREQIQIEKMRLVEHNRIRKERKYDEHYKFCADIMRDIVGLSCKIGHYREFHDGLISPKLLREWLSFFFNKISLDEPTSSGLPNEILMEVDFEQYFLNQGEWALSEPEIPSIVLSKIVQEIIDVIVPAPKAPEPPNLPTFSFKACIFGKPFSGKSSQALQLSQKYALSILVPEVLLQESISAYEMQEMNEEGTEKSERARLGEAALHILANGEYVDDELIVRLITNAIRRLGEDGSVVGWILDGFPRTLKQAQLLEKNLTGYDSQPAEHVFKSIDDGVIHKYVIRKSRLLSPVGSNLPINHTVIQAGVDAAFRLDVSDELIIRRAVGRRIDPETSVVYHIEYDPPPQDETINGRLVEVVDDNNSEMQIQHILAGYQSEAPLLDNWFSSLRVLQSIEASNTIEDIHNVIRTKVDAILHKQSEQGLLSERTSNDQKSERVDSAHKINESDVPETFRLEVVTPDLNVLESNIKASIPIEDASTFDIQIVHMLYESWTQVEFNYLNGVKGVFKKIRELRDRALGYMLKIKKDFQLFLKRPDMKQDSILNFQKDFNSIEDDIRADVETKQELHLRTMELRDILVDMANKKKEEADEERRYIMTSGWVEDFLRMVSHQLIILMQTEVDRYQNTRQILADYFACKSKKPIDESISFPSFDITEGEYRPIKRIPKEKETKKGSNQKSDPKKAPVVERPPSPKESKPIKKKPTGPSSGSRQDKNVRGLSDTMAHLSEIVSNAFSIIPGVASEGFFGPESPPELIEALEKEDTLLTLRIQKISTRATAILEEIRTIAETAFMKLDEWSVIRYNSEISVVDTVVFLIRQAIEEEQKLPYGLIADGEDVIIDEQDLIGDRPRTPKDLPRRQDSHPDRFTVEQLHALSDHFLDMAPRGVIRTNDFVTFMCRVAGTSNADEMLPEDWTAFDKEQYQNIAVYLDTFNTGYIDWREMIIALSLPHIPTVNELISLKLAYQGANVSGSGTVSELEFMTLPLWFEGLGDTKQSEGARNAKLKELYFKVFQDRDEGGYSVVDYIQFLLFLAAVPDAYEGLERACLVISADNVGGLVADDMYKVLHRCTSPYDDQAMCYYQVDVYELNRIEAAVRTELHSFTLSQFAESEAGQSIINGCPYYLSKDFRMLKSKGANQLGVSGFVSGEDLNGTDD